MRRQARETLHEQKARAMQKLLHYLQHTPQEILNAPTMLYIEHGELIIRPATSEETARARALRKDA